MQIERFTYLKKEGLSDRDMLRLLRYIVVPALNISFDSLAIRGMDFVYAKNLTDYPVWEVYLNVLIREYHVSQNEIADMITAIVNESNL